MRLTYKAQDQYGEETGTIWYASRDGDSIFPKSSKEEQVLKKLSAYEDAEEQGRLVSVRHGWWLYDEARKYYRWYCSCCFAYRKEKTPFCPMCGALMDKDGDGD